MIFLVWGSLFLQAQEANPTTPSESQSSSAVALKKLAEVIDLEDLKKHLGILASDAYGRSGNWNARAN